LPAKGYAASAVYSTALQQQHNGKLLLSDLSYVQGPGALYWGFVPFLIESFPYDLTELGTYSQLHDMREDALRRGSKGSKWMAQVPEQVRVLVNL
jgi:hypothetical protein